MKHYEELTRLHVEEAIQNGLKSQAAQRALSGRKNVSTPVSIKRQQPSRINMFFLLFQIVGKILGG